MCYTYFLTYLIVCRFPNLEFEYRDPEKNFDRRRVHGVVAKLIKLKTPDSATAIEVVAGGKVKYPSKNLFKIKTF